MKKSTNAKKIVCFIVAIAILFALPFNAIGALLRAASPDELHSFTPPTQSTEGFSSKKFNVSNPIFSDSNVTEFSSNSASGWNATTATNAVMGVVNTTAFDTFKGNQSFPKDVSETGFMEVNPGSNSDSPNVMVMANKSVAGTASVNFSQRLNEFWADGYFKVEVSFYAVGSQSAIYLIPEEGFTDGRALPRVDVEQVSIRDLDATNPDITTLPNHSNWQTATFYVKTGLLKSVTFTLGLYLGKYNGQPSGGVVYYDNIRVRGYTKEQFEKTFEKAKADNNKLDCVVDLSVPVYPNEAEIIQLDSPIFENFDNSVSAKASFKQIEAFATPDNTNIMPHVRLSNVDSTLNFKKEDTREVNGITSPDNDGAMLLSAVNASVGLKYFEPIKFKRGEIYMINFYALTSGSGVGSFRIRNINDGQIGVPSYLTQNLYNSGFLSIKTTSTSGSAAQNNWILNTVFVRGESLADVETYFEFWLGGGSNTTGFLLIDDFSVTRVSAQFYEKNKSSSNVTECNLDWLTATPTIDNANFNLGMKRSNASAYPLVASGWETNLEGEIVTNHASERMIINGIINTDTTHWRENNVKLPNQNKMSYGSAENPYEIWHNKQSINNNIYMMQNVYSTYQTIQSNSITLTSDTRNVISFDAATFNISSREVWAIIEIGEREVIRLRLVSENGGFTDQSGWSNYAIVIQTSKFTSSQARIKFALGTSTTSATGCLFIDNVHVDQASTAEGNIVVDLNDASKLYARQTGINADIGGESLFFAPEDSKTASAFYNIKSDVLSISTNNAAHAIVRNTMTEQLTEETAYEYIVRIAPNPHVDIEESYNNTDSPEWGMSIRIKDMEGGFVNLQNEDFVEMPRVNGLIELRFLIKSGTSLDLSLEIEFGNADVIVEGAIGIKGLELREYSGDFDSAEEDTLTRIITTSTSSSEEETEEEKKPGDSLSFLIIPSLITGVAIIVAVVGTIIRKAKFKKHIGKAHTSYARDDFETMIPKKDLVTPKAKKAPKEKTDSNGEVK